MSFISRLEGFLSLGAGEGFRVLGELVRVVVDILLAVESAGNDDFV